jgi:hypothetical protein
VNYDSGKLQIALEPHEKNEKAASGLSPRLLTHFF